MRTNRRWNSPGTESGGSSVTDMKVGMTDATEEANIRLRIQLSAANWQRKLLDLTKRNRALNFKPTRVSTVAIVDELPAEVFRHLVLAGESMRFKAADDQDESGQTALVELGDEDEEPSGERFTPYEADALDTRHTDDLLQTAMGSESLAKSLRRLDEQARSAMEEQGVNTLFLALGMLHYFESADSDVLLRAPLVLVPVTLSRRGANSPYQVRVTDDDPIVNPALSEHLRASFGLALPALPDAEERGETYDFQMFLQAATNSISKQRRWSVQTDIVLSLFSFQKLVMYKDLEANLQSLTQHRLVRQLVTRQGTSAGHVIGMPDDVRGMNLDTEYPPESTFQVVDADSSQLRAIAAAAGKHDLVIEGPPGTGKSQTITNLIAQALAAGKSVLFVAEKMAALQVVHSRLVAAGLGEFCLELHSTKANKRAVMTALKTALDASLEQSATTMRSADRLPVVRNVLNGYAKAVHTPFGTLAATPFEGYGELARVADAPRITLASKIANVTRSELEDAIRCLSDLEAAAKSVGIPAQHPWRDATRSYYTGDDLDAIESVARRLVGQIGELLALASAVHVQLCIPIVQTFADVQTAVAVSEVLHRSPGAPLAVLQSDHWNAPPPEAGQLIASGEAIVATKARLESQLTAVAFERDHESDVAYVEARGQGLKRLFTFFDGRHRQIRQLWGGYRQPSFAGSMLELATLLRDASHLRGERVAFANAQPSALALFGNLWKGEDSDWAVLRNYIRWVVEFRQVCVQHQLDEQVMAFASRQAPDIASVTRLRAAAAEALETLREFRELVGWPADYLGSSHFGEIGDRALALANGRDRGPEWAAFGVARRTVGNSVARELLPAIDSGAVPSRGVSRAFARAFWSKWLGAAVSAEPSLETFNTSAHEERVKEFRRLDQDIFKVNRATLVGKLRDHVQHRLRGAEESKALAALRREMARQRGHAPLRKTLTSAGAAVSAIKPCWMMSPLTVAQYVHGNAPVFDLVIFDEASQLPVEDAIGAVMRARQLVVVGDPKQLPPTNFFSASTSPENVPLDEDGQPMYDDSESILEEYMGAGMPMSRLRWHYRSAHESLITFSNVSFYEADLHTFPSVETGTTSAGLQFHFVDGGVYEGKGLNIVEARRVADEVVKFAREQLQRKARGEPTETLGVGTFNQRQQIAVQDELELRRRRDPSIEPFFDGGLPDPFFVKNLENIQGDERDVIFLSVTYAKATDGKMRYNLGPLNGENGWRRLNVITTRARRRMVVFSSIRGEDISTVSTTSKGAALLRQFLTFAERGVLESTIASLMADTDSPFESEVLAELRRCGYDVVPQVGAAGYRIDLGILDSEAPGRFVCGIECDGVAYHSSETARDRDRLRQQVLERRGWTILRVWSTDWFKDRAGQVARLVAGIEAAKGAALKSERHAHHAVTDVEMESESVARSNELESANLSSRPLDDGSEYERPRAPKYKLATGENRHLGADPLTAPARELVAAVLDVVKVEGPIHITDFVSRVAGMWGKRAGSKIQERILKAAASAQRAGSLRRRGDFFWGTSDAVPLRSRIELIAAADRIAPEEYCAAIRAVLAKGHAFSPAQLTTEVRALLGFARTGALLEAQIASAVESLLREGAIGEASEGLKLRTTL